MEYRVFKAKLRRIGSTKSLSVNRYGSHVLGSKNAKFRAKIPLNIKTYTKHDLYKVFFILSHKSAGEP